MNRFMIFMHTNQDDNGIDYKCYVKNLLRLFNKNIARERIDKRIDKNYFRKELWKKQLNPRLNTSSSYPSNIMKFLEIIYLKYMYIDR